MNTTDIIAELKDSQRRLTPEELGRFENHARKGGIVSPFDSMRVINELIQLRSVLQWGLILKGGEANAGHESVPGPDKVGPGVAPGPIAGRLEVWSGPDGAIMYILHSEAKP